MSLLGVKAMSASGGSARGGAKSVPGTFGSGPNTPSKMKKTLWYSGLRWWPHQGRTWDPLIKSQQVVSPCHRPTSAAFHQSLSGARA
jgi:hypothetical protein